MATFTLAQKAMNERIQAARQQAQFSRETGDFITNPRSPRILSRLGDEKQLRGIPAIGRGVTGAIQFTKPGDGIRLSSDRVGYPTRAGGERTNVPFPPPMR